MQTRSVDARRHRNHSTWDNGRTPTFTDDGTTTEWTPTAPSKYLLVRTLTNHGDRSYDGRLVVRFLQLKFSSVVGG